MLNFHVSAKNVPLGSILTKLWLFESRNWSVISIFSLASDVGLRRQNFDRLLFENY